MTISGHLWFNGRLQVCVPYDLQDKEAGIELYSSSSTFYQYMSWKMKPIFPLCPDGYEHAIQYVEIYKHNTRSVVKLHNFTTDNSVWIFLKWKRCFGMYLPKDFLKRAIKVHKNDMSI
jgi:hypothetical protein